MFTEFLSHSSPVIAHVSVQSRKLFDLNFPHPFHVRFHPPTDERKRAPSAEVLQDRAAKDERWANLRWDSLLLQVLPNGLLEPYKGFFICAKILVMVSMKGRV